jgi:hypothetical protein
MNIQHPTSNIQHPIARRIRRAAFHWMLDVGCWVLGVFFISTAFAQSTNSSPAPSRLDYSSFRVIADRNIFNPNRRGGPFRSDRRESNQNRPSGDSFSLVGTILYQKGAFAFFDGTSSDYKQVLEPDGLIAGHKVKEVLPRSVKLEAGGKEIEMKIGAQMRKEDGRWQLFTATEWRPPSTDATNAPTATASAASADSGLEMNDVLKKLMEQREKELK